VVVAFVPSGIQGKAPFTVTFTDASFTTDGVGIVKWEWVFGDGSSSSLQNPVHVYTNPSDVGYSVTLTVWDAENRWNSQTMPNPIKVLPADSLEGEIVLEGDMLPEGGQISFDGETPGGNITVDAGCFGN
jgi:PKD repeat protein